MRVALVAGGTGLVGSQLLQLLVSDSRYDKVKCLTRRAVPVSHPKIETIITDGSNLKDFSEELKADDVFCCLGTTMKKAKSKEAFKKVDFDYPLSMATIAKEKGAAQFLLISSLGADAKSSVFYNRVKGEVEQSITATGFKALHIFRPSLLLGARSEERSGEDGAKLFFKIFGFLVPAKYKAIDAGKVARAMLAMAKNESEGKFIHESLSLQRF
jgi:uncharacterized protein YbjT (DUF2867 family)